MYNIEVCSEKDKEYIIDRLVEYNLSQVSGKQKENFIDLSRKVTDEKGGIIGGIVAHMYCWNCIYIDTLWVSEKYRGKGIGKKLLKETEDYAEKNNVHLIHLDTFDFQAKDFYEKYGYEVFGILEDCPENHKRYFMKKKTRKQKRVDSDEKQRF
ncbi:N-acetyltransferase [Leptotrichia sp. OH3620_COT-345]|uniref:GNAT family N-acetyltransferase n=1 Tax=Leptotrichia sp. OH3620_COT-345 TaxID=2491048 RepID=UPI000F64D4DB|nr:GNAT family N-acetyltransferase [Leptotrichia sp. OH3620_COT-345]RRD40186.1 N-acetyltransferase [Leptotrichia sp. OH3620_COT-345]